MDELYRVMIGNKNYEDLSDDEIEGVLVSFVRNSEDTLENKDIMLKLKNILMDKRAKKETHIANLIETKKTNYPFDLIEINFSKIDARFKTVTANIYNKFTATAFEDLHWDSPGFVYKDHDISFLVNEILKHIEKHKILSIGLSEFEGEHIDSVIEKIYYGFSEFMKSNLLKNYRDEIVFSEFVSLDADGENYIESDNSEKLYNILEKERGKLTDHAYLKEELDDLHNLKFEDLYDFDSNRLNNFIFRKIKIKYFGDIILYLFKELLSNSSIEIAPMISSCKNIDDLAFFLKNFKKDKLEIYLQKKELEKKYKSSSIEEKKILSRTMKDLEEIIKYFSKICRAIIKHAEIHLVFGKEIDKRINYIQSYLLRKGSDEIESLIYLDGKPDPEVDWNHGNTSGDCTEGLPLPFNEPEIPAYNIKVLDIKNEHIGNIYLVETSLENNENLKIWHLDAIQIPRALYNWDELIPKLICSIAEKADAKNIRLITVNCNEIHISNYDFIQKSVKKFIDKMKSRKVDINLQCINNLIESKLYSHFQGTGEAFVLWD